MRRFSLRGRFVASAIGTAIFAGGMVAGPDTATALTIEQERSFSVEVGTPLAFNPAAPIAFDGFDPALGVLSRVEITLEAVLTDFAVTVSNPNPFSIKFQSYAQLDTLLTVGEHSFIGWFGGEKTSKWRGGLSADGAVTILYTPAFLGAFAPRNKDDEGALDPFIGIDDVAFSLGVMPRFDLPSGFVKPDFSSCAQEDQDVCTAKTLLPLSIAVTSNGAVSGALRLTYLYDAHPPRQVSAVPAPAAGPMLLLAAAGLFAAARRRKARSPQVAGVASATPRSR